MDDSKVVKSTRKPPNAGKGRVKGVPNKTTALLKDAILQAAEQAGDKEGMVGYLKQQAELNPGPFMALLGKVLPMQIANADDDAFKISVVERVIVKAPNSNT